MNTREAEEFVGAMLDVWKETRLFINIEREKERRKGEKERRIVQERFF